MGDGRELIEILAGEHGGDTSHDSSQDDGEEGSINEVTEHPITLSFVLVH